MGKDIKLADYAKCALGWGVLGLGFGGALSLLIKDPTYIGRFAGYGVGMGLAYTHGIKNGRGK